ncbi:MAG: response regulator transcription factor [Bacteroidota bacterium]|nr:response regulator transcription factor [Bacteroidota bacterium]
MGKIKIMVAEDHPIFRKGLVEALTTETIEVIGEAENGQVLLDLVSISIPDIVVLDLRMPILDGQEVLKIFAKDYPSIRTIVYSNDYTPYLAAGTIINGAAAYLIKNADSPELIKAIEGTYVDGYYFNHLISKEILEQLRDDKKKLYYLIENERFSEKEIEIIKLLCEGLSVAQIADKLNISENTVKHHKKNLFTKTGTNSIVELIMFALRQGIID